MQKPKHLITKGHLAFVLRGGQPGTQNMSPTAGTQLYFELDRRGRLVDVNVSTWLDVETCW